MLLRLLKSLSLSNKTPVKIPHKVLHKSTTICCYGCGDSLEDIFFHKCTCESCGKGAHYGYNCSPKVLIIPNPEPYNNQTIDELPQTLSSFDPTCYSGEGNSFTYESKYNIIDDSPNVFDPPSQPPLYSCKFCRNDAHYCTPQVPFIYPELCYNQDFNFPQNFHDFQQQCLCCEYCEDPHEAYQYQFEDFSDSNDDSTSIDDDFFSIDNIEYVEASPPDSELISLESSSTSLNFLLEETDTFDNSLPESETLCFDLEEISSGSTTTRSGISLPDYEVFYDDHVKEISSGSTTTDSDCSLYDSFIFDLSINIFPSADKSDCYEFADELAHIISLPEYDCFCFKNEPNVGDFTIDMVEDIFQQENQEFMFIMLFLPILPFN
nr:hypothetical protein [Tanacetum cinerariifolium]